MNTPLNLRLATTKMVLWLLVGVATAVGAVRYALGLGVTTALTDLTPWGLWIGLDVMAGVALAAGGFVIAAAVHVFHLERYHALLRPAVLTAFLGYTAVVLGLLVDLGRPWNIWRMMFYWQPTSALFEVGWCVMLYLTVLTLEFAPVVFEGLRWNRAFVFIRRFTLPLVVVGIALSTLHQSSLGTLLVIAPDRLHPLWYSPILPIIFLVSAIGLGLAMVTAESLASSWLFHREPEWPLLHGLTRAAAVVLGLYLALRLGDLAWRGQLRYAVEGSWASGWFLAELLVSTVVPIVLFSLPAARRSGAALASGAFLAVFGFILHRANVGGISHMARTGDAYFPAPTEFVMSFGVISAMALVFLFFVEHLKVWEHPPEKPGHFRPAAVDPLSSVRIRGPWFGGVQRVALAWVLGAIVGVAIVEHEVSRRAVTRPQPVGSPRAVEVTRTVSPDGLLHRLTLATVHGRYEGAPDRLGRALLIDGDRQGRHVLFEHERHQQRLGGSESCRRCHHKSFPLAVATTCSGCHRDMYSPTDTFDHQRHTDALGANGSCRRCHPDARAAKTREGSARCAECHARETFAFPVELPKSPLPLGVAPGYRAAMHGLCIPCHRAEEAVRPVRGPYLSRCPACHREASPDGDDLRLREGRVIVGER